MRNRLKTSVWPLCHTRRQYQSINQNLYNAPSRFLLRGASDPGQEEKNSLQKVVELRTSTIWVGALDLLEVHSRLLDQPPKSYAVGPSHAIYLSVRLAACLLVRPSVRPSNHPSSSTAEQL